MCVYAYVSTPRFQQHLVERNPNCVCHPIPSCLLTFLRKFLNRLLPKTGGSSRKRTNIFSFPLLSQAQCQTLDTTLIHAIVLKGKYHYDILRWQPWGQILQSSPLGWSSQRVEVGFVYFYTQTTVADVSWGRSQEGSACCGYKDDGYD